VRRLAVWFGSILVVVALAVLPLLAPPVNHVALDAAGSADLLGLASGQVHDLSDRSVAELVGGPGTFIFDGPDGGTFYDPAERGHLADARALLWLFLAAGAIAALALTWMLVRASGLERPLIWRGISQAGAVAAIGVVALGALSAVAFGTLFTLFHQVFFPGGGWAFDPATQHLVQLYPLGFWQIMTAAFGALVLLFGVGAWLLGRSMSRRGTRVP
jgi:integral membrane protein (TIGR01906 family)